MIVVVLYNDNRVKVQQTNKNKEKDHFTIIFLKDEFTNFVYFYK